MFYQIFLSRKVNQWEVIAYRLYCIAPCKRNVSKDSLQGFYNSYIMFWVIEVTSTSVA